jgi:hypothetical protein
MIGVHLPTTEAEEPTTPLVRVVSGCSVDEKGLVPARESVKGESQPHV